MNQIDHLWRHRLTQQRFVRGTFIGLITCLVLLTHASFVSAVITKVQDLGTNSTKSSGTTLAVTLSSGVTDGNSVIVSFAMDSATGAITCADDAGTGNSYSVDVEVNNTGNVRTAIISAHNVSGLTSGKVITITHPSVAARGMSVTEFSGLAKIATIDQTQSATGSTLSVSAGPTGTTTTTNELLIGAIGEEGKLVDSFTPGTSWTGLPRDGTSTGGPDSNITISPEYRIVSATGSYTADGTLSKNKDWAAAIATYEELAYLDQVRFRWRNDNGNESAATFPEYEDVKLIGLAKSTPKRLRVLVHNTGGTDIAALQLEVAEKSTDCASSTYSAVPTGSAGHWQIINSTYFTDPVATSNVTDQDTNDALTDPTGGSFVAGQLKDAGNTTANITLANSDFTEVEFNVQATTNATDAGEYCFRLYDSNNSKTLDNYTMYAQVNLSGATAVTLISFTAIGAADSVAINWETENEIHNMGFNLYRSTHPSGPFVKLNPKLIPGSNFAGLGKKYEYMDSDVIQGEIYYFKLEDIDTFGVHSFHGPISVDWDGDGLPDDWEILYGFDPTRDDSMLDPDEDGLTNLKEYQRGTDPLNDDTDGDGIIDGREVMQPSERRAQKTRGLVPGVEIIAEDQTGVTLELVTQNFDVHSVHVDGQEFERLGISDYVHGFTREVGKPEVPVKGIFVDIPADKSATLSVLETDGQGHGGYQIYPVPTDVKVGEGDTIAVREDFSWDQTAYSLDGYYPQVTADLGGSYLFRGQQKQQLMFYPLRYNPVTAEIHHYTRIRVRIDYSDTKPALAAAPRPAPWKPPLKKKGIENLPPIGMMASLLGAPPAFLNPLFSALSSFKGLVATLWSPPLADPAGDAGYKIMIAAEGIYRIDWDFLDVHGDLSAAEVNAIKPSQVRLYHLGEEVAIRVHDDNGNDSFDEDDYIEFYGTAVSIPYAKYARHNVYWLITGGGEGLPKRMGTLDGSLQGVDLAATHAYTLRYEQDQGYWPEAPGSDDFERWVFTDFAMGDEIEDPDLSRGLISAPSPGAVLRAMRPLLIHLT
jgi:hypothetical protein